MQPLLQPDEEVLVRLQSQFNIGDIVPRSIRMDRCAHDQASDCLDSDGKAFRGYEPIGKHG